MKLAHAQLAGMNLLYKWHSMPYFFDAMQELGFESISFWGGPPHFDCDFKGYQDVGQIRQEAEHRGLKIVGFLATSTNYRYQVGITEPEHRERAFRYFSNGIHAAADMGSPSVGINTGWGYRDMDREEAFKRCADMLWRLCEVCEQNGVVLALESLKALETTIGVTLEDCRRMVKLIDHKSLRIMPDTGAIAYNGERLEDWFATFGDQIEALHFVDGMHQAWGDGQAPLDDMMATLSRYAFRGPLMLETSSAKYMINPKEADRKAMAVLSRFIE